MLGAVDRSRELVFGAVSQAETNGAAQGDYAELLEEVSLVLNQLVLVSWAQYAARWRCFAGKVDGVAA